MQQLLSVTHHALRWIPTKGRTSRSTRQVSSAGQRLRLVTRQHTVDACHPDPCQDTACDGIRGTDGSQARRCLRRPSYEKPPATRHQIRPARGRRRNTGLRGLRSARSVFEQSIGSSGRGEGLGADSGVDEQASGYGRIGSGCETVRSPHAEAARLRVIDAATGSGRWAPRRRCRRTAARW